MSTTLPQRLDQVIKAMGLNPNKFALKIGVSRAEKIYKILRGESKPSFETIEEILKAYPMINSNWLIKGEGQMMLDGEVVRPNVQVEGTYEQMAFVVLPLLALPALPALDKGNTPETSGASYRILRVEGISYEQAIVLHIEGNSMAPRYPAGAKVIARPVEEGNWPYALGVHAITLKTGLPLFKRILRNESKMLHLVSDNELHGSLQVPLEGVDNLWKVGETVYMPPE